MIYKVAVDQEVKKMEVWRVIERATSPYINTLLTVIKKDQSIR